LWRNLLRMWRESSSVKTVNLVKKSVTVTEIITFSKGIVFYWHTLYMLCKQVCNKHGEKSNRWSLSLSAAPASTVGGVILSSRRPGHGWSQITECSGDFVYNSTAVHIQNGSREQNHSPFKGDLSSLCTKFESFSHSWDMDNGWGTQNLKRVTWRNHAPFRDGLLSVGWD